MKGKQKGVLFIATLLSMTFQLSAYSGELWAPFGGYSSVSRDKAYSFFYFSEIEDVHGSEQTYRT